MPNGFIYALEACLINLKLPLKLFTCYGLLESFRWLFFSHPKLLAKMMGPVEGSRSWSSRTFIRTF